MPSCSACCARSGTGEVGGGRAACHRCTMKLVVEVAMVNSVVVVQRRGRRALHEWDRGPGSDCHYFYDFWGRCRQRYSTPIRRRAASPVVARLSIAIEAVGEAPTVSNRHLMLLLKNCCGLSWFHPTYGRGSAAAAILTTKRELKSYAPTPSRRAAPFLLSSEHTPFIGKKASQYIAASLSHSGRTRGTRPPRSTRGLSI